MQLRNYSMMLGCLLAFNSIAPVAQAVTKSSDLILLNGDISVIEATVPTEIPISLKSDGTVTVASDLKITNQSDSMDLQVSNVSISPSETWSLADYSTDLGSKPKNTKEYAIQINSLPIPTSGDLPLDSPWVMEPLQEYPLDIQVKMPPQDLDIDSNERIGQVNFTIEKKEEVVAAKTSPIDKEMWDDNVYNHIATLTSIKFISGEPTLTGSYAQLNADASVRVKFDSGYTKAEVYPATPGEVIVFPEDCTRMFSSGILTELILDNVNTSNTVNMTEMFRYVKVDKLDLSRFDTSNVTSMSYTFENCLVPVIDLHTFDTSSVTDMSGLFFCNNLTDDDFPDTIINVSGWDTSNVTNLRKAFDGRNKVATLDLSSWDTSNVSNFYWCFTNMEDTEFLNLTGWTLDSMVKQSSTNTESMFSGLGRNVTGASIKVSSSELTNWQTLITSPNFAQFITFNP